MGPFDQTARQISKEDGKDFFGWLAARLARPWPVRFERWDDTRRTVWPGGPERTDDLVGILERTDRPDALVWVIVEVKAEPESESLHQLGVYQLLLAREVKAGLDGPEVGGVLLHLTGQPATRELRLSVEGLGSHLGVAPHVFDLEKEDAAATLTAIEQGELGLCVLPWVPLMSGGGRPELIERWKQVAEKEPNEERRRRFRDWALVLAELTKELLNWQRGLEGWMVRESQIINGWKKEGRDEGVLLARRAAVLRALRVRFQTTAPDDLRLAIEGTNDPDTLDRWFDAALTASTLDAFRTALRQAP